MNIIVKKDLRMLLIHSKEREENGLGEIKKFKILEGIQAPVLFMNISLLKSPKSLNLKMLLHFCAEGSQCLTLLLIKVPIKPI